MNKLILDKEAKNQLKELKENPAFAKQYKAATKALNLIQTNIRHQSLKTHRYYGKTGSEGEKIYEAYAEQNTPGALRIFFQYGPGKDTITILEVIAHP